MFFIVRFQSTLSATQAETSNGYCGTRPFPIASGSETRPEIHAALIIGEYGKKEELGLEQRTRFQRLRTIVR